MKSNKGFTLIELLAVIVILAIIALITVPIVIKIIDNAKKGAAEDSTYGIIETARLFWTVNQADFDVSKRNMSFECTARTTANATYPAHTAGHCKGYIVRSANGGTSTTNQEVELDIDGTRPKEGIITVNATTGQITVSGLKFGDYTCNKAAGDTKVSCS